MIYFDNNSTTIMPLAVKQAMLEWCNRGNPSSSYASAREARKMMTEFRNLVGSLCGVSVCCPEDRDVTDTAKNGLARTDDSSYKVIFTSGASEANCTMLAGIVDAYALASGEIPHVVMSAIEHKSLILMAESMVTRGRATVTFVQPEVTGHINPAHVESAITGSTCLVCVMHANNETAAINDIAAIGNIAHKYNVPFHCDTVQTFGKIPISVAAVDSFCISFHKFGGPPGVGALVIKQKLLIGYKIAPLIFGTQNEGLRGGTEGIHNIGASFAATKITMTDRSKKNIRVQKLRDLIVIELGKILPVRSFVEYQKSKSAGNEIILLSGVDQTYLHNTILLSVVKPQKPYLCNGTMKSDLEKSGIIVSVGSACNTSSKSASHILYAMGADEIIRKGTLRISLGDINTLEECKKFITEFTKVVKKQIE